MNKEVSNLPAVDHQTDQAFITIKSLDLESYAIGNRQLVVERGRGGKFHQINVPIYMVNHAELGGYMPSKAMWLGGKVHLLFYTHEDLPNAVRPFEEDGVFYAWVFDWQVGTDVRYPALSRVFIDQVMCGDRVKMLFIASSGVYESLLAFPEKEADIGDLAPLYRRNISDQWRK